MITKRFFSKKPDASPSCTLSLSMLSGLAPFNELPKPQTFKNILAYAQAKGFQLRKGQSAFDEPSSDQNDFYLLTGSVNLVANDGREENITSESPKAKMPLAYLRPRKYKVVVSSKTATFMSVPHHIVRLIYSQLTSDKNSDVQDPFDDQVLDPSELESVYHYFRDQNWGQESCLVTPISVGKAMWSGCVRAVDEKALSLVVMQDAALTAKLLKIARGPMSPQLVSDAEVVTIMDAIIALGRTLSLELIHHFLVKGQNINKLPALEKLVSFVAHRALQRAIVTRTLASISQAYVDPQKAYECGLLFRIGDLAMLQSSSEWIENEEHLANLQFVAERESLAVGRSLMQAWDLPDYLCKVLEDCHTDNFSSNNEGVDYAKLTVTAQFMLNNLYRQSEKSEKMAKNSPEYAQVMASMPYPEDKVFEVCQNALDDLKKARMAFMAAA